jgi:SAM-dependent methyltransferase
MENAGRRGDGVGTGRWAVAQQFESGYWTEMGVTELLKICSEKPAFLVHLDGITDVALKDKDVLEIGVGPLGLSVASFWQGKSSIRRLVKVEPLQQIRIDDTPASGEHWAGPFVDWVRMLAEEGSYVRIPGEALTFDREFDTVIIYNVLDHVKDPASVVRRAFRALRPGGLILVGVDCYSVAGLLRFELITRRQRRGTVLVEAHPHTFLPKDVLNLLRDAGFREVRAVSLPSRLGRLIGSHFRPEFVGSKG